MAKVEVEEADFLANQKVLGLVQKMVADPKARRKVLEAQKIVEPNTVLPTDYQDEVMAEVKKTNDAVAALNKKYEDEKAAAEAQKRTDAFQKAWGDAKAQAIKDGVQPEAVAEIEKLATERGIPDFEAATALYLKQHPPAAPAAPNAGNGFGGFNFFEPGPDDGAKKDMDALLASKGESEGTLNSMIGRALADSRGTRRVV
jgi:hypothetical protein